MKRTPDEILAEALDLPAETRAHLVESLISSLDESGEDVDPAELEREWLAEASRRAAQIDASAVQTRPAAAVFRARSRRASGDSNPPRERCLRRNRREGGAHLPQSFIQLPSVRCSPQLATTKSGDTVFRDNCWLNAPHRSSKLRTAPTAWSP